MEIEEFNLHGFPLEAVEHDEYLKPLCNIPHRVLCVHNFLSVSQADSLRQNLRVQTSSLMKKHGTRKHALFFDVHDELAKKTYRYGQRDWPMQQGIPPMVNEVVLQKLEREFGLFFNGVVYNSYENPKSEIWWHSDLQDGIGDIVATISTGRSAYLDFRVMHKPCSRKLRYEKPISHDDDVVCSVPCHHGTLVIMGPGVNNFYQHRVLPPNEQSMEKAISEFGSCNRENLTLHYHFEQTAENISHLNCREKSIFSNV